MRVYVTRPILGDGLEILKEKGHEVVVNGEDKVLSKEELKNCADGFDGVVTVIPDQVDAEVIASWHNVKIIANYAVGFDNIDVAAASAAGKIVTNTPGVLTEAVAEHTFALILALAKKILAADSYVRAGAYKQWEPMGFLGAQIWGKTLGVVGLGRIGRFVSEIASDGFRMNVLYFDQKRDEEFEMTNKGMKYSTLEELLRQSDFVSIHVPFTPETKHLINTNTLSLMKPTAFLINTARGPIVDEAALVVALKSKKIAGAGLDVYEAEPQLAEGLTELENVVLTPHTASATYEARGAMSKIVAENILAVFEEKTPPNVVTLDKG